MAPGKKRQRKPEDKHPRTIPELLDAALKNQDDFVLTHETESDGRRIIHVMSGKLITPCMLGTLQNRAELWKDKGSRYVRMEPG
jgi:hypothetical protein